MMQILDGWKSCYYNYLSWWWLMKYAHNDYDTWEFFTYLNPEVDSKYVMYLSQEDFDALIEAINKPPVYNENLAKILNRISPWETKDE